MSSEVHDRANRGVMTGCTSGCRDSVFPFELNSDRLRMYDIKSRVSRMEDSTEPSQ